VLYDRLPELRTAVGRVLGVSVARSEAEWPLLKPGATGKKVQLAQQFLRARGADVPTDGVFGKSTKDAVAALSAQAGLPRDTCTATKAADETGFLGADVWPLIVPADRSTAAWRSDLSRS
jgi:peptidoglycan hydrolase-like protein with peptidoglycan-binding domain